MHSPKSHQGSAAASSAAMSNKLKQHKRKLADLRASHAKLQTEHADCKLKIASLRERNGMLEARSSASASCSSTQSANLDGNSRQSYLAKENEYLMRQLDNLLSATNSQRASGASEDAASQASSFHSAATTSSVATASVQTEDSGSTDCSTAESLARLTGEIGDLLDQLRAGREREEALRSKLVTVEERVSFVREEKKELQKRADRYLDEKLEKSDALNEAKAEIQRLTAALADSDARLSAATQAAASAATNAEKRAITELKRAEERAKQAEERANRAESSLAELQRQKSVANDAEKRQLLAKCRDAERLAAEREQALRELDVRLGRAVAEAESQSREARTLKDRLAECESEKNRLQESAKSATNDAERRLAEERQRVVGFEQAQTAAREMIADLQEQVAVLKDQLKSAHSQLDRRQQSAAADTAAQLTELRSALHAERQRANKAESDGQRLLYKLREAESETAALERQYQTARDEWQTRAYQLEQTCAQQLKLIDYLRPFEEQLNNCRCRAKKVVRVLGQWNSAALSTPQRTSASTMAPPEAPASAQKYNFSTPARKA